MGLWRESAYRIACANNLGQAGVMSVGYANDNRGGIPPMIFLAGGLGLSNHTRTHANGMLKPYGMP